MTLQEAIKSEKPFKHKNSEEFIKFQKPNTGKYKDIVSCSYFIIDFFGDDYMSTSLDLYPEEICSLEWEIKE